YSLTVPFQPGPSNRYNDFVLYVAYNNVTLPSVHTALFLNQSNFATTINYTLNFSSALYTSAPVAVSLMTGFICDDNNDGEKVKVIPVLCPFSLLNSWARLREVLTVLTGRLLLKLIMLLLKLKKAVMESTSQPVVQFRVPVTLP